MSINLKQAVHHGVEGLAFAVVGTYVTGSFKSTCAAYGAGKVTYLLTKEFFKNFAPDLAKNVRQNISFVACLDAGRSTLQIVTLKIAGHSISFLSAMGTTVGITAVSLGARYLADKAFTYLSNR